MWNVEYPENQISFLLIYCFVQFRKIVNCLHSISLPPFSLNCAYKESKCNDLTCKLDGASDKFYSHPSTAVASSAKTNGDKHSHYFENNVNHY